MRKLLDIEEPEVEPTLEDRVVEGVKDKAVEYAVSSFGKRPSGWEGVAADFLDKNDVNDVLIQLLTSFSGGAGVGDDANTSGSSETQGPGSQPLTPGQEQT